MAPYLFLSAILFFLPYGVLQAALVINEVLTAAQTGGEWVEIYNTGDAAENMSGWQLYPDSSGYFSFPADFAIEAKKFVVVRIRAAGADSPSDLYHTGAESNMGNTAGSAALFSPDIGSGRSSATIKSFVQWGRAGQRWESAAADAGLWEKGSYAATTSASEGFSMGLSADGVFAGSAGAWRVFSSPTPGGANVIRESASLSSPAPAASFPVLAPAAADAGAGGGTIPPAFRAYAGQDRIVGAGSQADFAGSATGIRGEPLENARFLWNFGDGEVKEGRAVSHIFQMPGAYTVGLHISSGIDAASDYLRVSAVPNKITITAVLPGMAGFVHVKNEGDEEIDIGEWILKDGEGKQFALPTRTKIAPQSEIAFVNTVTDILKTGNTAAVALYYPNGVLAFHWSATEAAPEAPPPVKRADAPSQPAFARNVAERPSTVRGPAELAASGLAASAAISASVPPADGLSAPTESLSDVSHPSAARKEARSMRFFWITAVASGFAAAGFFVIKMFL